MPQVKYRFDELEKLEGRTDGPLSVFTSNELEARRAEAEEIEYPDLMGRILVPIKNDIPNGLEEWPYEIMDRVGKARWVTGKSDDFPRVDVFLRREKVRFHNLGVSYGWDMQELRTAQQGGFPLQAERGGAARDAIEEFMDVALLVGDAELAVGGLFTQPLSGAGAVSEYEVPDGAGASPEWADKTPEEILIDLHAPPAQVYAQTNRVERLDTVVFPVSLYSKLITTRDEINGNTLMEIYLANDPYIKNVFQSEKLETLGAGGTTRTVYYRRDPRVVQGLISQEFEQFPPQWQNLKVQILCQARTAGTIVKRPRAVVYADGQ